RLLELEIEGARGGLNEIVERVGSGLGARGWLCRLRLAAHRDRPPCGSALATCLHCNPSAHGPDDIMRGRGPRCSGGHSASLSEMAGTKPGHDQRIDHSINITATRRWDAESPPAGRGYIAPPAHRARARSAPARPPCRRASR